MTGSPLNRRRPPATKGRLAQAEARRRLVMGGAVVGVVVVVLFVIFAASRRPTASGGGSHRFSVGQPAKGQPAPEIRLAATTGGTFDLAALRGKTVLLYFQEGIGCQPCWDQIRDLEHSDALGSLGVDQFVSITSDPLDVIRQKVTDMGLRTPVLSDPGLAVSKTYHANSYGMMGASRDGHTFIVVGPDGSIRFRADYGGAPNYTMYVRPADLAGDIRAGLSAA